MITLCSMRAEVIFFHTDCHRIAVKVFTACSVDWNWKCVSIFCTSMHHCCSSHLLYVMVGSSSSIIFHLISSNDHMLSFSMRYIAHHFGKDFIILLKTILLLGISLIVHKTRHAIRQEASVAGNLPSAIA